MDAVKFLNEYYRLCKTYFNTNRGNKCTGCSFEINDFSCYIFHITTKPEKAVEIVEQWSKEHPVKTYKDDFLEKFPKTAYPEEKLYKHSRWCDLYNYGDCDKNDNANCKDCWNESMGE